MLSLESSRWSELEHAYGSAGNIPALLRDLASMPSSKGEAEPWFSLWSALAHQGDVYSASYATVPHVVRVLGTNPARADSAYFHFPAWVEICRVKSGGQVPSDLAGPYFEALAQLPSLVAAAAKQDWDEGFLVCALAAMAVGKGQARIAEAILELNGEVAEEFMEWFEER